MNEVLDPKFPAEENKAVETNLSEVPVEKETESVLNDNGSQSEDVTGEEIAIVEATPAAAAVENIEQNAEDVKGATSFDQEESASQAKENEVEESSLVAELAAKLSRTQIIERIQLLIQEEVETVKNEIDSLKQAYYKLRKNEVEEARKAFFEVNGEDVKFELPLDETEEKLKELLSKFREKKALLMAEEEKEKEANLAEKKTILDELKALIESQDDFNKVYNEFRRLQLRWKEIKLVPQAQANELWKEYQHYSEIFYDLLKINNEMRIYDFKKNLEIKNMLIESVEKLEAEPDVVSAFHQLQKFHQEWREIGPVAKELREEIWGKFKAASSVINKKHQDFFETLRAGEQENLAAKTAICEEIEAINYDELKTFGDWDQKSQHVLGLQQQWKTVGFAPKKHNIKIFERFRAACDVFFQKKGEFYKEIKEAMEANLKAKTDLCVEAESLKDSADWKETTEKLIALQKKWKTIGQVSRKHSDAIWRRFITACDYFFEQKNQNFAGQKTEEQENLRLKKELIAKINDIAESLSVAEAMESLRELMSEWNNIGHVPFREKDKMYKEYRTAVDKHFDRLKIDQTERRLQSFRSNINEIAGGERSKGKLLNERDRLMRTFEKLKSDIQTYENNIGFLSISSKGGGGLVKEMNRKIEDLKAEQELIVKKIQAIDDNLDA